MLAEYYVKHQFIVYVPKLSSDHRTIMPLLTHSNIHMKTPRKFQLSDERWRTGDGIIDDARRHGVNVFTVFDDAMPSCLKESKMGSVLIVTSFPERKGMFSLNAPRRHVKQACDIARHIVTVNEQLRHRLVEELDVDATKVTVVHAPYNKVCDDLWTVEMIDMTVNKYSIPANYVVCDLRHSESDDDVETLMQAMSAVSTDYIKLLVLYPRADVVKRLARAHNIQRRVVVLDRVHRADVPAIYKRAQLMLAVEANDDMPVTVLDAQRCGLPVVALNTEVVAEYGGRAVTCVDTPQAMAHEVDYLLGHHEHRAALSEAGLLNSEDYNPETIARHLMAVYSPHHA